MLEQNYDFKKVEQGKYQMWKNKKAFESGDLSKKPYCIVIPPPNVTGKLHLGHAMDNTLQDLLSRYHRMKNYDVLWVPGMDHAGIATQAKVDERLKQQGISRYDLGREGFLKQAWAWKDEYANYIHDQWAKLGISVDYNKERFTLDDGLSKAVSEVFVKYYKEGLIYRGKRVINWDPEAKTALSNIEVEYKEINAHMYYMTYKLVDSNETFVVATTRPETMFADVCVVVNPNDPNTKHLIGKTCINPANKQILPIIGDDYIEIGFGTGIMKCTPAHDPNDYQIALRHKLEMPICINEDGTMNSLSGIYEGLDRFECREKLIEQFKNEGCLSKIEDITHSVAHSERTGVIVEPYLSNQWFVKMKPLADDVLKHQENNDTKINFYPKRFEKTFTNWLTSIEDWCISRQLWWGHRIPVWYHKETQEIYCDINPPKDIENYIQDEDVLDTWFSSALWPFTTLGWPDKTNDLDRYFPNNCMVTGYDIIFFWVARMAFSARHFLNDRPFKDCLIHGLIRDENGRKMSKSLGNGIDPIEVIETYGCDSLRLFLTSNSTPGLDTNFKKEKVLEAWNFINKLWNASRFVMMNIEGLKIKNEFTLQNKIDHWIISKLNYTIKQVEKNIERYEFSIASNELTKFIWDDFCSNYIEFSKTILNLDDINQKQIQVNNLIYILTCILKMLHPYIPFVTEEIYQEIYNDDTLINQQMWPTCIEDFDQNISNIIDTVIEIINAVRQLKQENDLKPSKLLKLKVEGFVLDDEIISILNKLVKVEIVDDIKEEKLIRPITNCNLVFILNEIIDKEKELLKIDNQLIELKKEIDRSNNILNNQNFISKAKAEKVLEEKTKLENYLRQFEVLQEQKNKLK